MTCNAEKYLPLLEQCDMTLRQKEEAIQTVYVFMESFVDQAFGVHPVQQCRGYAANDNLQSPANDLDSKVISLRRSFKER